MNGFEERTIKTGIKLHDVVKLTMDICTRIYLAVYIICRCKVDVKGEDADLSALIGYTRIR